MNFGAGPKVIMALAPGGPQKSYMMGDKIGEFKLVTIASAGLIFDWEGKQVPARFEEMRDTAPRPEKSTGAPAPPAPAASGAVTSVSPVTSVASGSAQKPGVDVGDGWKGCQAGDTSPAGTVVDGYRKVVVQSPFGGNCRWEKVK
jgi:hypothetical protein